MPRQYTPRVERICEFCGSPFMAKPSDVRIGRALYCGFDCKQAGSARKKRTPIADRFWTKVEKTDTCWLWTASVNEYGYGLIGSGFPLSRTLLAHRVSYEWAFGPIPPRLEVCHTCDVPRCVNPAHFVLGTHRDNMEDMSRKGRQRVLSGKDHPLAVLDKETAQEIRCRFISETIGKAQLAREYGVSVEPISQIVYGTHWSIRSLDLPDLTR